MDINDIDEIKAKEKFDKEQSLIYDSTVNVVLSSYQGRQFVWELLVDSGLFKEQFSVDSDRITNYLLGKAAFGKMIFARIQTKEHIDNYRKMQDEALSRAAQESFEAKLEREENE